MVERERARERGRVMGGVQGEREKERERENRTEQIAAKTSTPSEIIKRGIRSDKIEPRGRVEREKRNAKVERTPK